MPGSLALAQILWRRPEQDEAIYVLDREILPKRLENTSGISVSTILLIFETLVVGLL
jgi:hypothetical protein